MPEPRDTTPGADYLAPNLGAPPRAERNPAELLTEAATALAVIAANFDPFDTQGLGIGLSDARVASTPGPQRWPLLSSAQTVLPQNRGRRGLAVYHENPAASILYICYGNNASPLNYTVQLLGGQLYELQGPPFYAGEVSLFCSTPTGAAQVTELN